LNSSELEHPRSTTALRTDIEKALDELISYEEGFKFQQLAVVLAKEKWPDLIASEFKKDLGLDAYAPVLLARDVTGKGLASSLTATLAKIKADIQRILEETHDVRVLIFSTPCPVTMGTAKEWKSKVREDYDIDLVVVSREDIITDLMLPSNARVCRNLLGIPITIEPEISELLEKSREAAARVIAGRIAHPLLAEKPKIRLQAIRLEPRGRETGEVLDLASFHKALLESRRIWLEAPAGRGKTTMLLQLAERHEDVGDLAFFIDLPEWMTSGVNLMEFIARMPPFLSRGLKSNDLARLCEAVHCSFLLNGWNEISDKYSKDAVTALASLERIFPAAGIIVATRTHSVRPPLPGSFRAKLLPLTGAQRTDYLQQSLGSRATELGAQLEANRVLDDLTRTPLFLTGVTTIFQSGAPIPKTKMGVLAAMVVLLEESDEHQAPLSDQPLSDRSNDYLSELAVYMTIEGDVTIPDSRARDIVKRVAKQLTDSGQITELPEPRAILSTLSAHHVLERQEYPSVQFKFQHQQFQEFYAALVLKRQLWNLVGKDDPNGNQVFAREYVNKPLWAEPLGMIAEEIGEVSLEPSSGMEATRAGARFIELALAVNPVLAAELARLCGSMVWREVRSVVGRRLRSWYRVSNEHHQRCAMAAMLASGSEEFSDIILPRLTSDDQLVRQSTYDAWGEFHVSSLGIDWRRVVGGWKEDQRADFVGEVVQERKMARIAEEFAHTDPSPRVRSTALRALQWVGASDAVHRVLDTLNEEAFEEVLLSRVLVSVPPRMQPRARAAYERLLDKVENPLERLHIRLAALEAGGVATSEGLKEDLKRWPSGRVDDTGGRYLKSVLELVRKTDPQWVSRWVAYRLLDGSLWGDHWAELISSIPSILYEWLDRIGSEDLQQVNITHIISVLAATANADLARDVFSRMCATQADISTASKDTGQTLRATFRQLEAIFRALPPNIAVAAMLSRLSAEFTAVEFEVAIEVIGKVGVEDSNLRSQVEEDLRQRLRRFVNLGVSLVLSQNDFNGQLKANLSLALARVGDSEDMPVLHRLILSDIERLRTGRRARSGGESGPLAVGATRVWSHWHVRAVTLLDPQSAVEVLLMVLSEPEYEEDAAKALVQLAKAQDSGIRPGFKEPHYNAVWEARSGRPAIGFDEDRRCRYALAIEQRMSSIKTDRLMSDDMDSFNHRLKVLASTIAILDGRAAAEVVMEIMAFPGKWDGWMRAEALEALLFSGARLGANAALGVLNPTIDQIGAKHSFDQQDSSLLQRCLCLLPFLDPPAVGIDRMREVITATRFSRYALREIVIALGQSRCKAALGLLLELARSEGNPLQGIEGEWVDSVAALNTPESKEVLLSFIDPDVEHLGIGQCFNYSDQARLASHVADIARAEPAIEDRLYLFRAKELSPTARILLADVVAQLGTPDALSLGLDLINDYANPPVPHSLRQGLESVFLERRPHGDTQLYQIEPRSSNKIRSLLFNMILNDDAQRRSAWDLLGQIESWRLEYGRPSDEPWHPAILSGELWPPAVLDRLDCASGRRELR
jgi:hypothetical protein